MHKKTRIDAVFKLFVDYMEIFHDYEIRRKEIGCVDYKVAIEIVYQEIRNNT